MMYTSFVPDFIISMLEKQRKGERYAVWSDNKTDQNDSIRLHMA